MNRRFTVEEVDNGWLVKISEAGSDKLVGRMVFTSVTSLFVWLETQLKRKPQ